jgi:mRNA interferase RelE/StbE
LGDWRIAFVPAALKGLKRLSLQDQLRMRDAIDRLMEGDIKKLRGRQNQFRLRVGGVRAVFTPNFKTRTILILEIFQRGENYR